MKEPKVRIEGEFTYNTLLGFLYGEPRDFITQLPVNLEIAIRKAIKKAEKLYCKYKKENFYYAGKKRDAKRKK